MRREIYCTMKAEELFRLAVYDVPYDTFNPHNFVVWRALNILKAHMLRMEKEIEELKAAITKATQP